MAQFLYPILKTVRPRQWLKNLALFASLLFSGFLFDWSYFSDTFIGFLLFCGLTSAVYIFNDIVDVETDRKHPFKRKRPIASGDLSLPLAKGLFVGLLFGVLLASWYLSFFFFVLCLAYLVNNILYSSYLKQVPVVDVMMIAAGFIIRVYAGAIINGLHMNVWFLFTVISLSLFLAVGKRQSERTLLKGYGDLKGHRVTLSAYSTRLLDIYTGMFATATWFTYALFAFQHDFSHVDGPIPTLFSRVPRTLIAQKWLMLTVPVVIFGVMRYLQLVYERNEGESPARVLLSDKPLLVSVLTWMFLVIVILYLL